MTKIRRCFRYSSLLNARQYRLPLSPGTINAQQRNLERYRRMTAGQRLKLVLQSIDENELKCSDGAAYQRALFHGWPAVHHGVP